MTSPKENAQQIGLAIILHPERSEVLVARRKKGAHLEEFWELPGGKMEPGETAPACAAREAREEAGLDVVVLDEWDLVVFAYPDRRVELHPVLCKALSAEAQPLESDEIAWVGAADLASYVFPPANEPITARLQAYLEEGGRQTVL